MALASPPPRSLPLPVALPGWGGGREEGSGEPLSRLRSPPAWLAAAVAAAAAAAARPVPAQSASCPRSMVLAGWLAIAGGEQSPPPGAGGGGFFSGGSCSRSLARSLAPRLQLLPLLLAPQRGARGGGAAPHLHPACALRAQLQLHNGAPAASSIFIAGEPPPPPRARREQWSSYRGREERGGRSGALAGWPGHRRRAQERAGRGASLPKALSPPPPPPGLRGHPLGGLVRGAAGLPRDPLPPPRALQRPPEDGSGEEEATEGVLRIAAAGGLAAARRLAGAFAGAPWGLPTPPQPSCGACAAGPRCAGRGPRFGAATPVLVSSAAREHTLQRGQAVSLAKGCFSPPPRTVDLPLLPSPPRGEV